MKHLIKALLTTILIGLVCIGYAQNDYNPFASIGKKAKIITASNGEFEEFNYDTIQRIGSVLVNTHTKKIVKLLDAKKTFAKASDNSAESRWYRPDRLAEKYYDWSPYNFVENNPIKNMDPTGDALVVTGSASAVQTYQNIVNTAFGGQYTLGQTSTGKYELTPNSIPQDQGLSSEQQALYNTLSQAINDPKDIKFNAVDGNDAVSKNVIFGDNGASSASVTPGTHTIDVGDMSKLGPTGAMTAQGALGHEIKEGYLIQTKGLTAKGDIDDAHNKSAIPAENAINGSTRFPSNAPDIVSGAKAGSQIGTFKVLVLNPGSTQGVMHTVTITFQNGNIVKVTGNNR